MKGMSVLSKEISTIVRSPKVLIPVIAILFIPLLYSGIFLGTFWDPYAKMSELPVAVVNADKGANYEGKSLDVGSDVVKKLKENPAFQWHFVDEAEAEDGLRNNRYYLTVKLPEDFSKKATTLMEEKPQQAEIIVESNEGHNFLAAQIGGTGMQTLKSEVSAEVTKSYTETVFDQLTEVSEGLTTAGDGATKLSNGVNDAESGANLLKKNLGLLVSGTSQLKSGVDKLQKGSQAVDQGAKGLQTGASQLAGGLGQLTGAQQQLLQGANKAKAGTEQLAQGLNASVDGSAKLSSGAEQLAKGLEQYIQATKSEQNPALQQLLAASQALAKGTADLHDGQVKLSQGATQLEAGQAQLQGGMTQFGTKLSEAAAGGKALAAGAKKLAAGTAQLPGGMKQVGDAVVKLSSGSTQLNDGAGKLTEGLVKLKDGSSELATKLNDAADKTSGIHGTDERVDMFATPVTLVEKSINKVPNYGTGFAPYFLSLGLFVGALISTIVIPLRESPVANASGWSRFVSKTFILIGIGVLQALFADAILLYGLGLEVESVSLFVVFSIVTSLTYMFIVQGLVTALGNPGRFAAIVILILQLTTCGGTFPVELTPKFYQMLGAWLPMTYTVNGFKAIISMGDHAMMWHNVGILSIFAAIFLVLTFVFFQAVYGNKKENAVV
ncbi:YhgE/Pip domain-containing protein [Paenibacillus guangzhouensis]|uniref:YhgE/Pip domain-containing protein n=1 Tax=Paenibacillus guangzhouensis TaxID=1473112 RepID=UPI0012677D0F|nr:YhgE/Pip domain-containing protein [Paenibacillus guangzhouensis]